MASRYAKAILWGSLLVLVVIGCGAGCRSKQTNLAPAQALPSATAQSAETPPEQKAPDFSVTDIDGKKHSLKDYAGKILVLDFWATYCKPCVEHLRDFNDVADRLRKQGVEFLAISLEDNEKVIRGWRPEGFEIPLAHGDEEIRKAFFGDKAIIPIPQVRIVDRKGMLRYSFGPEATSQQIKDAIHTLLIENK